MPLASTNCVGAVWWLCWVIEIPLAVGLQPDLRSGRKRAMCGRRETTSGCRRKIAPWPGARRSAARPDTSVALTAIDVEDVAADKRSFVRRDEDDRVGKLLREAEAAHRNRRHQS